MRPWLILTACSIVAYACARGAEPAPDEISQLRQEIQQMRADYEKQIKQLEQRLDELTARTAQTEPSAGASHDTARAAQQKAPQVSTPSASIQAAKGELQLPVYVTKGFSFEGYMRSGHGVNSRGGDMVYFKAPGADAKYRLGNENDTYGELALAQQFNPEKDEPYFKAQVRLAYSTKQMADWSPDTDKFTIREAFVQAAKVIPTAPSVSFWAGERFYHRHDIHINDFYVFDMSGYGGGVEEIQLGPTKLALAFIGGSNDKYEFDRVGQINKKSLDMRLYDIPMPLGTGMVWVVPSGLRGGDYTDAGGTNHVYESSKGFAVGLLHRQDVMGGYNQLTLQYGLGTGSDFDPNIQDPNPDLDDAWQFRATDSTVLQLGESASLMTALIYQRKNNGMDENPNITWISGGLRPIYQFTRHLALALEAGADYVDSEPDDYSGTLVKLTLAPEVRINNQFFGRPVIRAFATYAVWGDEFKGYVGGTAFAEDTSGMNYGVQAEAWW